MPLLTLLTTLVKSVIISLEGDNGQVCAINTEYMDMRNANAKTDEDLFGMKRIQKRLQKINGILGLIAMCGLFFSLPPTTHGFMAWTNKNNDILLDKIDNPQWKIGYNFTVDCPEAFRQQEEQLKETIVKALQTWLQPLRKRYPNKQFTDDFLLLKLPDVAACEEDRLALRELDTRITFDCMKNPRSSFARIALTGEAPDICMRKGVAAGPDNQGFIFVLVHELGHAFGLDDTYVYDPRPLQSTGGLAFTIDKQPRAVMGSASFDFDLPIPLPFPFELGEDDKNGIIYLYKYLHEGHPADDCFFSDYIRVEWDGRCCPKYPLIFEAKYGIFETVRRILRDDPTLDLNARDSSGFTALHHAVQRGNAEMVKLLLAQAGIKVNLLNTHKRTPAQLARVLKQIHLAKMIEAHPTSKWPSVAWDVSPKSSLTTTWGALKRAR